MAVLGLRFCARAFSSCGKWGPLFIAVRGPLIITASLVVEHRLQTLRLSNCGSRAQLLRGMWDLPRPGLEPVSPALASRFSTTAPPVKPSGIILTGDLCLDNTGEGSRKQGFLYCSEYKIGTFLVCSLAICIKSLEHIHLTLQFIFQKCIIGNKDMCNNFITRVFVIALFIRILVK